MVYMHMIMISCLWHRVVVSAIGWDASCKCCTAYSRRAPTHVFVYMKKSLTFVFSADVNFERGCSQVGPSCKAQISTTAFRIPQELIARQTCIQLATVGMQMPFVVKEMGLWALVLA